MPKIFRRSWEVQRSGRAGAISGVLNAHEGTCSITGASFAAPVAVVNAVTGTFTAADVGRRIRLYRKDNNSNAIIQRYCGLYIIDSVNVGGNTATLRLNHNISGHPGSPARFFENTQTGPDVPFDWYVPETCTFTADTAGQIDDFLSGTYVTIGGSTNPNNNNGVWEAVHRVDNQTVLLSKAWFYYNADPWNVYHMYALDYSPFVAETGLKWKLGDRESWNAIDMAVQIQQAIVDSGWVLWQQRGHRGDKNLIYDNIYKSTGEDNTGIAGGKCMFMRVTMGMRSRVGEATNTDRLPLSFTLFHHWDPTLTSATNPGSGIGGIRTYNSHNTQDPDGNIGSEYGTWDLYGSANFIEQAANGYPQYKHAHRWSFFGDRDEMFMAFDYPNDRNNNINGPNGNFGYYSGGFLKTLGSNPNVMQVVAPVVAGANAVIDVGTVDPTALTPPYAVGDNITIIGYKTSSPSTSPASASAREFVETATILSFDQTDPLHRKIIVNNLLGTYGNGPDTLKAQVGEDPYPVFHITYHPKLHNVTRLNDATGRDHHWANAGRDSQPFQAIGLGELNPNRKTNRWGLSPTFVRDTVTSEFRGRCRYYWRSNGQAGAMGTKFRTKTNEVWVCVLPVINEEPLTVGPMTPAMANVD